MIVVRGIGIDKNFGAEPVLRSAVSPFKKVKSMVSSGSTERKTNTDENSAWNCKGPVKGIVGVVWVMGGQVRTEGIC